MMTRLKSWSLLCLGLATGTLFGEVFSETTETCVTPGQPLNPSFEGPTEGWYFMRANGPMTFAEAQTYCEGMGAQLPILKTEPEFNSFIAFVEEGNDHNTWVGLKNPNITECYDADCENKIYWLDGTAHNGQSPIHLQMDASTDDAHCIRMRRNGRDWMLADFSCGADFGVVCAIKECEIECQEPPSAEGVERVTEVEAGDKFLPDHELTSGSQQSSSRNFQACQRKKR